jgi:HNH endonuclease
LSVVDDELGEWITQWRWQAHWDGRKWYAIRHIPSNSTKNGYTTLKLHRAIWEQVNGPIPASLQIDHINGDGLDNRMENLRLATNTQNQRNRGPNRNNSSGYKGVGWNAKDKRWKAQIQIAGVVRYLGNFDRKVIAALHYDQAAIESFDEFAYLNLPNLSLMIAEGRFKVNLTPSE